MADPPPGLALDGAIRPPEPFAWSVPPTELLVNDGAVAASETGAMPTIGRGPPQPHSPARAVTTTTTATPATTDAQATQLRLATAAAQLDGVEAQQGIVPTPPPDANIADAEDAFMTVGLEPPEGITLEQAVVDFPPPIHLPERPWNRVPNDARKTYTVTCMSRPTLYFNLISTMAL